MYDAVILAGGRAPWLKELCGTDVRCLAQLNGKRIIDYLAEALQKSGRIKRILLAAPAGAVDAACLPAGVELCDADCDMPTTSQRAAAMLKTDERILFICDDIPLLTPEAVCDFLQQCECEAAGQVCYAVIPRSCCEKAYPEAQRTYVCLKDDTYTGGNICLVDPAVIPGGVLKAREVFARRKKPLALCGWLGFGFILKFLLHRLSVHDVVKRASELFELQGRAIVTRYAEVGMDIDKPADWQIIEKYLAGKR